MRHVRNLIVVMGCVAICRPEFANADDQCQGYPGKVKPVPAEESDRPVGSATKCLNPVASMTGEAVLFEKRPGWSPGRIAVSQHASGYYVRLGYKVPVEWSWYGVNTINPLVLGLEDGTELALYPACEVRVSAAIFTGYFRANREQLERLSVQRVTYVKQFITMPADVEREPEHLEQTADGLSYFLLRSAEDPPTESLRTLAGCMLDASEVESGSVVVPAAAVSEVTEPKEKGPYSKKVEGRLWLEGFAGPSSYDPDRFGAGNLFFELVGIDIPRVKGPEWGVAFGGTFADQVIFLGAAYRQANYEIGEGRGGYKLMKVGLDMQFVFSFVPYIHPLARVDAGYAKLFGGNFSVLDVKTNGLYFTLGVGVRIPVVRWVSFVTTFDWSNVIIYPKGGEGFSFDGSEIGGTFGLTLHFLGVK